MFYDFRQNNSGGRFVRSDKLDMFVIVEADTVDEANERAERLGIYFNGCDDDRDCPCCGDRWSEQYGTEEGDEFPATYGEMLTKWYTKRCPKKYDIVIHFKDGRIRYAPSKPGMFPSLALENDYAPNRTTVKIKPQSKAAADAQMWAMIGKAKAKIEKTNAKLKKAEADRNKPIRVKVVNTVTVKRAKKTKKSRS
jgi:hypothetical protein